MEESRRDGAGRRSCQPAAVRAVIGYLPVRSADSGLGASQESTDPRAADVGLAHRRSRSVEKRATEASSEAVLTESCCARARGCAKPVAQLARGIPDGVGERVVAEVVGAGVGGEVDPAVG
jgi:hypothetical protein